MTFERQQRLHSPTGATLNLLVALPAEAPRAIVQINHGLAEHAARYARFASFLTSRGFAVYVHDHRGHGHTSAPDAPLGSFGKEPALDKVMDDVLAVHDLIASEHPGTPVIVFGHSMGALIALNFVSRHPRSVAGAAIWNATLSAGLAGRAAQAVLAWERFRLGSDVPSRMMPKLTFATWGNQVSDGRTAFDWLSRDHDEVDRYVADPLCGWDASVGMWKAIFDLIFQAADERNFDAVPRDMPFHLVGGGMDPSTGRGKVVEGLATRMRRTGFSNLVSTIYPQNRHESLNELNRDLIMADFADWAERQVVVRTRNDAESS
ncbi:alpha/beta hydrolase [Mesorhizobium sp. CAU 1741]|uniref:alpha/beta hydrolase n=1 Tax=Mesorhizobium sp. CAU 1741 TaxID=3140366 RepID=UPI00325BF842